MTDPELPPAVLFQAFRTWNCGISALEERDLKAQLVQLLVLESLLTPEGILPGCIPTDHHSIATK